MHFSRQGSSILWRRIPRIVEEGRDAIGFRKRRVFFCWAIQVAHSKNRHEPCGHPVVIFILSIGTLFQQRMPAQRTRFTDTLAALAAFSEPQLRLTSEPLPLGIVSTDISTHFLVVRSRSLGLMQKLPFRFLVRARRRRGGDEHRRSTNGLWGSCRGLFAFISLGPTSRRGRLSSISTVSSSHRSAFGTRGCFLGVGRCNRNTSWDLLHHRRARASNGTVVVTHTEVTLGDRDTANLAVAKLDPPVPTGKVRANKFLFMLYVDGCLEKGSLKIKPRVKQGKR